MTIAASSAAADLCAFIDRSPTPFHVCATVSAELDDVHATMLARATAKLQGSMLTAETWPDFMAHVNNLKVVRTPWCDGPACEEKVKERSAAESKELPKGEVSLSGAAKTLCKPLEQAPLDARKCFHCGEPAKTWVLWGRSY